MIMNVPFDGTTHSWSPAQLQFSREKYKAVLESLQTAQDRIELAEDDLMFAEDLYVRMNKLVMQLDLLTNDIRDRSLTVERLWTSPRS
jgi:hypothetical protein